jgi:hypothetical protein
VVVTTLSGTGVPGYSIPTGRGATRWMRLVHGVDSQMNYKLKALMQGYLKHTNGRVHLVEIFAANSPKVCAGNRMALSLLVPVFGRCTYRK